MDRDTMFGTTLSAAKAGSPRAWHALYERHAGALAAYLEGRAAPHASDLVTATFVAAVDRIHLFEGTEQGLRAWLTGVADRLVVDAWIERGAPVPARAATMAELADRAWLTGSGDPLSLPVATEVKASLRAWAVRESAMDLAAVATGYMALAVGALSRMGDAAQAVHSPITLPDAATRHQAF